VPERHPVPALCGCVSVFVKSVNVVNTVCCFLYFRHELPFNTPFSLSKSIENQTKNAKKKGSKPLLALIPSSNST
jgi:hypothetical protein